MLCFKNLFATLGSKLRERERESKRPSLKFLLKPIFFVVFLFLFFTIHSSAYAATYYVRNDGSDARCTGLADAPDPGSGGAGQACSWQTISKVNGSSFSAGDSVLFKKGGTWREQLVVPSSGSSGNPITFSSYGSGAKPLINGANLITSWTQTSVQESGGVFSTGLENETDSFTTNFTGKTTAGSNTVLTTSDQTNHGSKAMKSTSAGSVQNAYAYKDIASQSDVDLRFYVYIDNSFTFASDGNRISIANLQAVGTDSVAQMDIQRNSASDYRLVYAVTDTNIWGKMEIGQTTITKGAWHLVEFRWKAGSGTGGGQYWIDGVSQASNFGLTTVGNPGRVVVGMNDLSVVDGSSVATSVPNSGSILYFDDIRVDNTSPIGAYAGSPSSNVYYATLSSPLTNAVWENTSTFLTQESSLSSMIQQSQYHDLANSRLYVWTSDGTTPSGKTIEAAVRDTAVSIVGKNYITLDGLQIDKSNTWSGGVLVDGTSTESTGVSIKNSTFSYNLSGVDIYSANNVTFDNNLVYGDMAWSAAGIILTDNGANASSKVNITNNVFHGLQLAVSSPIDHVENIATATISGNTVYNIGGNGINLNDADDITIENNIVHDGGIKVTDTTGIHLAKTTNSKVGYNIVYDWSDPINHVANGIQIDTGSNNVKVYYNITYNNDGSGISVWNSTNISVFNNVAYGDGQGIAIGEYFFAEQVGYSTTATIENNIGYATVLGIPAIQIDSGTSGNVLTITNNDWYTSSGNWYSWAGSSGNSLATWNALADVGTDLNTDPLFVNTGTHNFSLQPSSPAINAGINVGLTTDYAGNSVPQGSAPDMGAYEYLLPSSPSALVQYLSDGVTVLTTGAATKSANVDFSMSMSSTNSADTLLTPEIEIEPIGTSFTNTANYSGSGVAYSGTPVTGTIAVTGLADGNYHWQASASNSAGTGNWVSYGGNTESATDFTIDTTAPSTPGTPMPTPSSPTNSTTQNWVWTTATDAVSGVANYVYRVLDNLSNVVASGTTTATNLITNLTQGVYNFFVKAVDNAGNQGSESSGSLTVDTTAPTGGTITYTDGYYISASVSLTVDDGTDTGGSNINTSSRIVQRKSATLTNGTCGSYGSFGTITPTGTYPNFTDTTVNSSTCYQYQYLVSDNAGNQATYTSSNTVYVLSLPLSTSSLAQYQSDGVTSIPSGSTLGIASTVVLTFNMSSTNSSDTLTPQVEVQNQGTPFTNTPNYSGSAVSFTGTTVTGTVTIPNMGGGNYHWQARVINSAGQSSWVAMGGNPDFSINFPPAANNSSAPSGCSNQAPSSSPDLFQIDTINTKATVYFAPAGMPYDNYVIRYGPTANNLLYSASFTRGFAGGVIYYTINELSPNTVYYFQVRAGNGCKPGEWGNTLSAKTTGSINSTSKSYKSLGGFIKSLLSSLSPKYTGPAIINPTPTIVNPTPTTANNNTPGQCTQYTVLRGDSFWTIAQKLLGSGKRYLEIWQANTNTYPTLKNSPVIRTGWKLSVGC